MMLWTRWEAFQGLTRVERDKELEQHMHEPVPFGPATEESMIPIGEMGM